MTEKVKTPKISVVMQSFLGDYPGARSNPVEKFQRAVNSFLNQTYSISELVIVADECNKTWQIYDRLYRDNPKIKFAFIAKDGLSMYEEKDGQKYYRGIPRRVGVSITSGDLITYMDSDDYLMPNFLMEIAKVYNQSPTCKWWINRSWYDNVLADWPETEIMYAPDRNKAIKVEGLVSEWIPTKMKPTMVVLSPWLFTHVRDCGVEWEDSVGEVSEDVLFNKRVRAKHHGLGAAYEIPTYVRCHYTNKWDF